MKTNPKAMRLLESADQKHNMEKETLLFKDSGLGGVLLPKVETLSYIQGIYIYIDICILKYTFKILNGKSLGIGEDRMFP